MRHAAGQQHTDEVQVSTNRQCCDNAEVFSEEKMDAAYRFGQYGEGGSSLNLTGDGGCSTQYCCRQTREKGNH